MPSLSCTPSSMQAAFADHQSWLQAIHAAHARALNGDNACATGAAPPRDNTSAQQPSPQPLPQSPMIWAQDEALDVPFSDMALGSEALDYDDFDGPVYRSLGSLPSSVAGVNAALYGDDFDEPVYRSLSAEPLAHGGGERDEHESNDQLWLQTMPPLLKRQRAGPLF